MSPPAARPERGHLAVRGVRLELARFGRPGSAPVLLLLHEGLGSVSAWRDWPEELAQRTGLEVLAYSRQGYGRSDPVALPRPLDYMQREAGALAEVLDAAGVSEALMLGHSDGGSIALVHAGTPDGHRRVRGLVLLAPHVFCEKRSVEGIEQARLDFTRGDLRERLARHHDDVDGAFWGWNRAWLDPGFRRWNIEASLPQIRAPILVLQGDADQYGTLAQLDAIERGSGGPVERLVLAGCGHWPHRERRGETTAAVVDFVQGCAPPPGL